MGRNEQVETAKLTKTCIPFTEVVHSFLPITEGQGCTLFGKDN